MIEQIHHTNLELEYGYKFQDYTNLNLMQNIYPERKERIQNRIDNVKLEIDFILVAIKQRGFH